MKPLIYIAAVAGIVWIFMVTAKLLGITNPFFNSKHHDDEEDDFLV